MKFKPKKPKVKKFKAKKSTPGKSNTPKFTAFSKLSALGGL